MLVLLARRIRGFTSRDRELINRETLLSLTIDDVVWADGVTYMVISAQGDKQTLRSGQVSQEEITITPGHSLIPSLRPWHQAEEIWADARLQNDFDLQDAGRQVLIQKPALLNGREE